jgi:hypothetical protein
LIVPGIRIGAAELGPADQGALARALGEPDQTEQRNGHAYYMYTGQLTVDFDLANDAPFEISTASPAWRTQEGLGVGSTATAIRNALGSPLCAGGDDQSEGVLVYGAIWFQTAHGAVTRIGIRPHLSPSDFQNGPLPCNR